MALERYSTRTGYCYADDARRCEISGRNCDEGTWISAIELKQWSGPGGECRQYSSLLDLPLGYCGDSASNIVCSPNIESCPSSSSYVKLTDPAASESVNLDTATQRECRIETTRFGSCNGESGQRQCLFSPEDCPDYDGSVSSSWTFPNDECSCDLVRVGGCQHKDHQDVVQCAVNAQACDYAGETTFFPWNQLLARTNRDCFLCQEAKTIAEPVPTPSPSEFTSVAVPSDVKSSKNMDVITIAATVGTTVLVMALGAIVYIIILRRTRPLKQTAKRSDNTIPENIASPQMDDESDNVSVL